MVNPVQTKSKLLVSYEVTMAVLALISVLTLWRNQGFFFYLDFIVWMLFVLDVSLRFIVSKDKWGYIKKNPLDIIAIIPFNSIFRLARLVRLFRVIRSISILNHYLKPFYEILRTNNLDKVLIGLFVLIFVSSIPIQILEPNIETYIDAIWWAVVTATTVGYGDISPQTVVGRLIAVVLMLFGIGLLGLVTSSVATYFLKSEEKNTPPTINHVKSELGRIEELSDIEIKRIQTILETYKKGSLGIR